MFPATISSGIQLAGIESLSPPPHTHKVINVTLTSTRQHEATTCFYRCVCDSTRPSVLNKAIGTHCIVYHYTKKIFC